MEKLTKKQLAEIGQKSLASSSKGGVNTFKKYGSSYMSELGKKGRTNRWGNKLKDNK
jgi:hypothetical protein